MVKLDGGTFCSTGSDHVEEEGEETDDDDGDVMWGKFSSLPSSSIHYTCLDVPLIFQKDQLWSGIPR